MTHSSVRAQRGGTFLGIVLGLLIGLGVALAVALYIAKVPVPFVDKVPHRTAEQDAAEAERNKNWDPNAPLAGKQGTKAPNEGASAPAATPAAAPADAGTSVQPRTFPPAAGSTVRVTLSFVFTAPVTLEERRNEKPCFCSMRWKFLATSRSMPGRMRSRYSITVKIGRAHV